MTVEFQEYRKTATVEAVQVTHGNGRELAQEHDGVRFQASTVLHPDGVITVDTREGTIEAMVQHRPYLCRGVEGELWLVAAEIFEATYELVEHGG